MSLINNHEVEPGLRLGQVRQEFAAAQAFQGHHTQDLLLILPRAEEPDQLAESRRVKVAQIAVEPAPHLCLPFRHKRGRANNQSPSNLNPLVKLGPDKAGLDGLT